MSQLTLKRAVNPTVHNVQDLNDFSIPSMKTLSSSDMRLKFDRPGEVSPEKDC